MAFKITSRGSFPGTVRHRSACGMLYLGIWNASPLIVTGGFFFTARIDLYSQRKNRNATIKLTTSQPVSTAAFTGRENSLLLPSTIT